MKLLHLDIETAPNVAHVWGLWNQNVSIKQLMASGYTLCWAAKWHDKKKVMFDSIQKSGEEAMLRQVWELLDEADAVCHYNGKSFDIPTLNREFVTRGWTPPAPYQQLDLIQTARSVFRFPSNKMDYLLRTLGHEGKVEHKGHELWIGCMANDPASWRQMERYNRNDVKQLEKLYNSLRSWIRGHPNMGLYSEETVPVCVRCGSTNLHRRGVQFNRTQMYRRFKCMDCGGWSRQRTNCTPRKEDILTAVES